MKLTAQDLDTNSVPVVLSSDQWPHEDDQQISKASDEGNDPDGHSQHHVGQQVLQGRDAVSVGLTGAHVGRVRAVLERLEIAGRRTEEEEGCEAARAKSEVLVCLHVGEVRHGQEHLCFDIRNLYPLQSPIGQKEHYTWCSVCECVCVCVSSQGLKMNQVVKVTGVNAEERVVRDISANIKP